MLFKSTTILTSTACTLLQNHKGQLQAILVAAAVAGIIVWKLGLNRASHSDTTATYIKAPAPAQKTVAMKWSYDEMAHKLIVENTDLAYAEISEGFTKGIGQALSKVARQSSGKGVVVNL